jgi:hypothetical protein
MTNLGKTLLALAAVGILASIGLAVRAEREPEKAAPQLTPAQRVELFKPEPQQPKIEPARHFEAPPADAPEDGEGS